MSTPTVQAARPAPGFRHEALLYAGEDEFVERTMAFICEGLETHEPVLVAVGSPKIDLLVSALDGEVDQVYFADMAEVGRNPARIIPAWRRFLSERLTDDRPVRGIGEPIWAERSEAELVECQRHESLLNLAFADSPAWRLLCPYDTATLGPAVIEEARRSHPFIVEGRRKLASASYRGLDGVTAPFSEPLPEPAGEAHELDLSTTPLDRVRRFVFQHARAVGLGATRAADLVLAAHEVAANTLRHSEGGGTLRVWHEDRALICEVRDGGHIDDPLAGREPPRDDQVGGWGLWMVNQLCDLAQIRSFSTGSAVRLHMRLPDQVAA